MNYFQSWPTGKFRIPRFRTHAFGQDSKGLKGNPGLDLMISYRLFGFKPQLDLKEPSYLQKHREAWSASALLNVLYGVRIHVQGFRKALLRIATVFTALLQEWSESL